MDNLWAQTKVEEMIRRGVLALNDGYRVRNVELGPVGIPFVRGGDIGEGEINTAVEDHIRPEFTVRVQSKLTRPFDVAFITKGTVGRVGMVRPGQPPLVFAPQVCYWRSLDPDQLEPRFLYYLLTSAEFQANLHAVKTHGSMAADYVSMTDQKDFWLTFPPMRDQKTIAAVLGSLDDKIELNRRMNATLEAMARALFQSWFVDFDPVRRNLDGCNTQSLANGPQSVVPPPLTVEDSLFPDCFQDSEVGHVPKGWEIRSLDKTAHYLNGLALQKYPPNDGPTLPVIKIAQLRKGDHTGADRCSTDLPPNYIVQDGDVLFSWSGSLEVELWCGGPGALNQHLFKVTSPEFPKWFYYLWTLYHLDEFRLIAADKATTMGHIQRGHLTAAKVLIPPRPLLDAMTRTMSPLIDQLIANRIQSRTLATLRDTLLPKLLSGKISIDTTP
jgi:type I restriction enzyme S subunit